MLTCWTAYSWSRWLNPGIKIFEMQRMIHPACLSTTTSRTRPKWRKKREWGKMERKTAEWATEGGLRGADTSDAITQKVASGEEMKLGLRKGKSRWRKGGKNWCEPVKNRRQKMEPLSASKNDFLTVPRCCRRQNRCVCKCVSVCASRSVCVCVCMSVCVCAYTQQWHYHAPPWVNVDVASHLQQFCRHT